LSAWGDQQQTCDQGWWQKPSQLLWTAADVDESFRGLSYPHGFKLQGQNVPLKSQFLGCVGLCLMQ